MSIKTNFEMPRGDDPVKQAQRLSQDLSSNFKAIHSRVNSLTNNTTNTSLIGTVIHSMLTLTQIQTLDPGFVLMDGSSCAGSTFATITGINTLPDASGRFLRGKGTNNPDGSLSLGAYTADKVGTFAGTFASGNCGGSNTAGFGNVLGGGLSSGAVTITASNETAPKNITVNIFIKIN